MATPVNKSFCVLNQLKVYGPFFFTEKKKTQALQNYLFLQLNQFEPQDFVWQQDGAAPPHFLHKIRDWLNDVVSQRWIGRAVPIDRVYY